MSGARANEGSTAALCVAHGCELYGWIPSQKHGGMACSEHGDPEAVRRIESMALRRSPSVRMQRAAALVCDRIVSILIEANGGTRHLRRPSQVVLRKNVVAPTILDCATLDRLVGSEAGKTTERTLVDNMLNTAETHALLLLDTWNLGKYESLSGTVQACYNQYVTLPKKVCFVRDVATLTETEASWGLSGRWAHPLTIAAAILGGAVSRPYMQGSDNEASFVPLTIHGRASPALCGFRLGWKDKERHVWAGALKHGADSACPLALLSPDIVRAIINMACPMCTLLSEIQ